MNNEELKAYELAVENHERAMFRAAELERELAALKAQPGGVVLPEYDETRTSHNVDEAYQNGWNACLDEVARLNQQPASGGVDERAARVIGYRPGMSEVTLLVDGGSIPRWMNIGDTVHVSNRDRAALAQSERVPDIDPLLAISRKILAKLQHPTESVHAGDMWKLEEALAPFPAAPSPSKQGGV